MKKLLLLFTTSILLLSSASSVFCQDWKVQSSDGKNGKTLYVNLKSKNIGINGDSAFLVLVSTRETIQISVHLMNDIELPEDHEMIYTFKYYKLDIKKRDETKIKKVKRLSENMHESFFFATGRKNYIFLTNFLVDLFLYKELEIEVENNKFIFDISEFSKTLETLDTRGTLLKSYSDFILEEFTFK